MRQTIGTERAAAPQGWPGWCCSYCSGPLEPTGHGLHCPAEDRWFATDRGVHRLLPEERRRELQPLVELYQRVRRDAGFRVEPGLPEVRPGHPRAELWRRRARSFRRGLELAEAALGRGAWRVLDAGAGCCWASDYLLRRGHHPVAVDVNLDPEDGLLAAGHLLPDPARLPRAEAELEALPLEPGGFDLVLAAAALHYAPSVVRALVELRRVTRRGGLLLVLDTPVFRRRKDGEARLAERRRERAVRYGVAAPHEAAEGFLVLGELPELFRGAGWSLEVHGWPAAPREWAEKVTGLFRSIRRPRYPILAARREG